MIESKSPALYLSPIYHVSAVAYQYFHDHAHTEVYAGSFLAPRLFIWREIKKS